MQVSHKQLVISHHHTQSHYHTQSHHRTWPCDRIGAYDRTRAHRPISFRTFALFAGTLAFLIAPFLVPQTAHAQTPNSFWIPPYTPPVNAAAADAESAGVASVDAALRLIVDTDPGVDDAVALAWLLSVLSPSDILGIVTVAGNTTVENATANVNTVLSFFPAASGIDVIEGAKKPLSEKLSSSGLLIHGQDGLWGQQMVESAHRRRNDARDFYCSNARHNPSATILALGPLTNLAEAVRHCRRDMQNYARVVILGGAQFGGNHTPVAEFNFWQDAQAAQIVLDAGLNIELVPLNTFTQFAFAPDELGVDDNPFIPNGILASSAQPVFQYLAFPVALYGSTQALAGAPAISIPDLTAAIYTVHGLAAPVQPALVEVLDHPDLVRGQSVIGLDPAVGVPAGKFTMVASEREVNRIAEAAFKDSPIPPLPNPGYDLVGAVRAITDRVPDNAKVVLSIMAGEMHTVFLETLASAPAPVSAASQEQAPRGENLYLPSVTGR